MTISIRDLSKIIGCSTATISNALNFKKNVNPETAEKIRNIASQYGYKFTKQISQVRFIIYKSTGAVVSDTPFFSSLISGIESECKNLGFPLTITSLDKSSPTFDQEIETITQDTSCGNILLATEMSEDELSVFQSIDGPLVILDAWFPQKKMNTIQISNQDSAEEAVNHLITKGHRNIGYIKSKTTIQNFKERYAGYSQALMNNDINPTEQISYMVEPSLLGSYHDMLEILSDKSNPLPTAFFADNDNILVGCLRAFQEKGISIPNDISLIGFDDMPFTEICNPPLTTIKVPKIELGINAVRRLKELAEHPEVFSLRSMLSCKLIKRGSVLNINKKSR